MNPFLLPGEDDDLPFPPADGQFLSDAVRVFTADGMMQVGRITVRGSLPITPPEAPAVSTQTALLAVFQAMPPELQLALRSLFSPAPKAAVEMTLTAVLFEVNGWTVYLPEVVVTCGKGEPTTSTTKPWEGEPC